jgi:hypothetical protein
MCASPIKDHYTRIVGYYTPVSAWNGGRRKEHKVRVFKDDLMSTATKDLVVDDNEKSIEKSSEV